MAFSGTGVIITGDDFGLAIPVNEAIEGAHRRGILNTASLMVTEGAAADAIERARRLPLLRVGLHLVLVEGRAALPPELVPSLVDERGAFSERLYAAGLKFFFEPGIRRQLEAEIRAQFEAFRRTGLVLDHVNAHNHMHLHPTVLELVLAVGREYGLPAVRVPREPWWPSWRASGRGFLARGLAAVMLAPWTSWMRSRLRRAGIRSNDFLFGLHDSGGLSRDLLLRLLSRLPAGVTEIYFHPASRGCPELDRTMSTYDHVGEYAALVDPDVYRALAGSGVTRVSFQDL
jgi:hopanoid biosynthesis associated protein HpnK